MARYVDDDFEFAARDMSFRDRAKLQAKKSLQGVLLEKVESAGWAALAGLYSGDVVLQVDGKPTPNVKALETILAAVKKKRPRRVVFFIKRGIHTTFREIEPDWDAKP
jgi:S1-C subfamily serine protease